MTGPAYAQGGPADLVLRRAATAVLDALEERRVTIAVHPDAELLRACLESVELWRRHSAAFYGPTRIADDEERDRVVRPIWSEAKPVLRRICDLPATTLDGHQARAAILVAWDAGALFSDQDVIVDLMLALVADLLAKPQPATSVLDVAIP